LVISFFFAEYESGSVKMLKQAQLKRENYKRGNLIRIAKLYCRTWWTLEKIMSSQKQQNIDLELKAKNAALRAAARVVVGVTL